MAITKELELYVKDKLVFAYIRGENDFSLADITIKIKTKTYQGERVTID